MTVVVDIVSTWKQFFRIIVPRKIQNHLATLTSSWNSFAFFQPTGSTRCRLALYLFDDIDLGPVRIKRDVELEKETLQEKRP